MARESCRCGGGEGFRHVGVVTSASSRRRRHVGVVTSASSRRAAAWLALVSPIPPTGAGPSSARRRGDAPAYAASTGRTSRCDWKMLAGRLELSRGRFSAVVRLDQPLDKLVDVARLGQAPLGQQVAELGLGQDFVERLRAIA
jgi:hypothetical protein